MRDNQHVSDYLVHFSGLALHFSWEEPALRYRFYKGLPPWIKDELSKSEKPRTLQVLKQKVENIEEDTGNKLKNVLVNNNIGKIHQSHPPLQHLLFCQLLQNLLHILISVWNRN
jgi:hypothetical protein